MFSFLLDNVACLISFCSITNNTGRTGSVIWFPEIYFYEIRACNIISNMNPYSNSNMILTDGKVYVSDSLIVNNSATYMISNRGGYDVTLSNCTVDETSKCSGKTNFVSKPATSFINRINFFI